MGTITGNGAGADSVTTNGNGKTAESGRTAVKSLTVTDGKSSLTMVPTPCDFSARKPGGVEMFTLKVSSFSIFRSPTTWTVIVCVNTPRMKVSIPLTGV